MATQPISENSTENGDIDLFELAFGEALEADLAAEGEPEKKEPEVKDEPEAKDEPEVKEEPEAKDEPEVKDEPEKKEPDAKDEPEVKDEPDAKDEPEVKPEPKPKKKPEPKVKTEDEIRADLLKEQEAQKKEQDEADRRKAAETLSDDEQALMSEVDKDFPDVTKALKIQERILTSKFENLLDKRIGEVQQQLAPVFTTTQQVAQNAHEAAILKKHADAFDILPTVEEWIGTQPALAQRAYNEALDKGTSEEIIELFDIYKASVKPADTGGETPEEKATRIAAEKAAQAKKDKELQEQEAVKTRQTTRTAGIDENDFEGAFEAAASK